MTTLNAFHIFFRLISGHTMGRRLRKRMSDGDVVRHSSALNAIHRVAFHIPFVLFLVVVSVLYLAQSFLVCNTRRSRARS